MDNFDIPNRLKRLRIAVDDYLEYLDELQAMKDAAGPHKIKPKMGDIEMWPAYSKMPQKWIEAEKYAFEKRLFECR